MNFRSVVALAIPLAIVVGCSDDDDVPSDAGTTTDAAAARDGAARVDGASSDGAAQADRTVQPDAAAQDATLQRTDATVQADTAVQADATVRADAVAPVDAIAERDGGAGPEGGALAERDGGGTPGPDAADGSADGAARDADANAMAPRCGPFADGGAPMADASTVDAGEGGVAANASFFVTSQTNPTGNLGGLVGADARCQTLATAAGLGSRTWRAYLSAERGADGGAPVNARDRIGTGPWYNVRGALVASDLAALHSRPGDPSVFLDEQGRMISGQWTGSPTPNEHDILTGSNADGTVAIGKTCEDWTSAQQPPDGGALDGGSLFVARVGHSDGIGPMCSTATAPNNLPSWNSSHDSAGCHDTAPRGGSGRIYCFAN